MWSQQIGADRMNQAPCFVVFRLDEQHYAVPLSVVERIVRMVDITPVPKTPEIVLGVINVQGSVIPVVDIRRRDEQTYR